MGFPAQQEPTEVGAAVDLQQDFWQLPTGVPLEEHAPQGIHRSFRLLRRERIDVDRAIDSQVPAQGGVAQLGKPHI
ncbi:hypothetical protein D9M72_547880 [compost metagenome]